jgi:hypothetical protein
MQLGVQNARLQQQQLLPSAAGLDLFLGKGLISRVINGATGRKKTKTVFSVVGFPDEILTFWV